jgi:hypothetical protein
MKSSLFSLFLLFIATNTAMAAGKSITFFSDGALVEMESSATKGIAEINLPGGMLENSLRIRPIGNTTIKQVDLLSARVDTKRVKEIETLAEQRSKLEDRLKALETREDIFKAAAKSQSGKAPRKTKTNPDPMQSIRQGTEYAIAQLESVYTARRKTEQEIRRVDTKLAALKKNGTIAEAVARVAVSPKNGRIIATYALPGFPWTPIYDLRLNNDGIALLTMSGQLPSTFSGYQLKAAAASLSDTSIAPIRVASGSSTAKLADYRLPVKEETFGSGLTSEFSCILTNQSAVYLPPGEASVYRRGEFWGKVRFDGISSGRSRTIKAGTRD